MDSYRRMFGTGLSASAVPTISTGVPLSARFQQIKLVQEEQNPVQFVQPQRSVGLVPGPSSNDYYYGSSEFQGGQMYSNQARDNLIMRQRMIARQAAERRAALELQQLRQLASISYVSPLRTRLSMQNRIGQRGGRVLRAPLLENQISAIVPSRRVLPRVNTVAGGVVSRNRGGVGRGRVATSRVLTGVPRIGLAGRIGASNGSGNSQMSRNAGRIRGGRGRNMISTRGGGRGGRGGVTQNTDPPSREDLDSELDKYMANSKNYLDKELDDYMAKARDRGAGDTTAETETPMEAEPQAS